MLSGLSTGLVNDGVSGLKNLPATAFAFKEGTRRTTHSRVLSSTRAKGTRGQEALALPTPNCFGVSIVNVTAADGTQMDLTLFGVEPDSFLLPAVGEGDQVDALMAWCCPHRTRVA